MARLAWCSLFLGTVLSGQPRENHARNTARAYRLDTRPVLDGLVNEPLWSGLEPATGFIQQEPQEGAPATERTEVRIGYDDQNLYFGVICFDSDSEHIVVTQNRRDAPLEDTDSIQILLDTFNDDQNAFVFGT
ncbi:MAG: carbohydrate binding family 9 domain-containing protein, partial [Acidobacteria bacterium]|nr:carbohydrate binding family 9 domain-containing protein [Acidobacteriota bacterium]